MTPANRIMLVIALLLLDWVFFFIPGVAILATYIILARPPWFKKWVERLYE